MKYIYFWYFSSRSLTATDKSHSSIIIGAVVAVVLLCILGALGLYIRKSSKSRARDDETYDDTERLISSPAPLRTSRQRLQEVSTYDCA